MNNKSLVTCLALALATVLSGVAVAGDTTVIEVSNNGVTEKVSIDDLKTGETRQILSESGTLVTATRLADSLVLDIGGDKTTVPMIAAGEISEEELLALIDKDGGDGKKRVVRIHHADGAHGAHDVHDAPHVIVADGEAGKQVIVKRIVKKGDGAQP